jgi:hypothetical protein
LERRISSRGMLTAEPKTRMRMRYYRNKWLISTIRRSKKAEPARNPTVKKMTSPLTL